MTFSPLHREKETNLPIVFRYNRAHILKQNPRRKICETVLSVVKTE